MCTLTIQRDADFVRVTMNRDERHERIETGLYSDGWRHSMLFPEDSESRGTWIGVNASGVILCLLNRYDRPSAPVGDSRGRIIVDALALGDFSDIETWLCTAFRPDRYNPFSLFVIGGQRLLRLDWTGARWNHLALAVQPWLMVTSSSENIAEVTYYRQRQFERWLNDGAPFYSGIPGFHFQHDPTAPEKSVLMSRVHSQTKSLTQITLFEHHAQMLYLPRTALNEWVSGGNLDDAGALRAELDLTLTIPDTYPADA